MSIKGSTSKYSIPEPNPQLFKTLFNILHEDCFEANIAATSRALGITRTTVQRWDISPPKQWWWPYILIHILNHISRDMALSSHKKIRQRSEQVKKKLHQANLNKEADYIEFNEARDSLVQRRLLIAVNTAPGQSVSTKDLQKVGIGGGFSPRAFRRAAQALQLDIVTEGFGPDKQTYYEMPREAAPDTTKRKLKLKGKRIKTNG